MIWIRASLFLSLLLLPVVGQCQENPTDPCESLLGASGNQPAWPGIVLDADTGDTLQIQLKNIGIRRVKLAGIQAPKGTEPLSAVSRFHLAHLAKGLRVFVILDPPWTTWPAEVTAIVEDFAEAQLAAGLAKCEGGEIRVLSPYIACRCSKAEQQAKNAGLGIWGTR
jgi:endonuclease YncB( thermonuclease family)